MTTGFQQFCAKFSPLTEEALDELVKCSSLNFRKGQYLIKRTRSDEAGSLVAGEKIKMLG